MTKIVHRGTNLIKLKHKTLIRITYSSTDIKCVQARPASSEGEGLFRKFVFNRMAFDTAVHPLELRCNSISSKYVS